MIPSPIIPTVFFAAAILRPFYLRGAFLSDARDAAQRKQPFVRRKPVS
jgi:hypothetical protein